MEENLPPSARAEHMNKPIGEKVPRQPCDLVGKRLSQREKAEGFVLEDP